MASQLASKTAASPMPSGFPMTLEISAMPAGLPSKLDSELAWTGSDFADESTYIYNLTVSDIDELGSALVHFKG